MTYLLTTPGYDPASGFFLAPIGKIVEVPAVPTPEQVQAAADLLLEPWQDFSFASPGQDLEQEVSRSVAIYGMIVATNRRALDIAPGIAIDAPPEGMSSGKTLASKSICIVATGEEPIPAVLGTNFEEQRKALVTYLVMGNGALLIDNITNGMRVDSAALASMMTSPKFMDRLLGADKIINANTQVMVVINGNALNLAGDLASRFLKMRLDTGLEKPQNRSNANFKIPDLIPWMIENRQWLVAAVHTIVRAYLQECPRHGGTPPEVEARRRVDGSRFGGQCEVLRDAFLWAFPALPDPFLGGEASVLSSSTRQEKTQAIHLLDQRMADAAWKRLSPDLRNEEAGLAYGRSAVRAGRIKFSSSEILAEADPELESTLQAMLPREATLGTVTLGRWLKNGLVDSPIDGLVMRSVHNKGKGLAQFWIESASDEK